ncbi:MULTISPECIES: transposase [unclassified Streptomyces]|uniref:transposase n=1 Tax=unclassified Streptomyces TaxID=2593676 RepID=UPI00386C412D
MPFRCPSVQLRPARCSPRVFRGIVQEVNERPKRGGRWRDHREVIDAIAFKFQTGTQWVHLPEKYGNWRGVYNRLRMWAVDGTWERVFCPGGPGRRERGSELGRFSGFHDRAGSPARGRRPQKGAPAHPLTAEFRFRWV